MKFNKREKIYFMEYGYHITFLHKMQRMILYHVDPLLSNDSVNNTRC
jgi:hypothetical protein